MVRRASFLGDAAVEEGVGVVGFSADIEGLGVVVRVVDGAPVIALEGKESVFDEVEGLKTAAWGTVGGFWKWREGNASPERCEFVRECGMESMYLAAIMRRRLRGWARPNSDMFWMR